ncbi:FadR/GntR family transcriptional regulator [Aquabacter sp. CN5-332]|uniref:FadR/GntR family transcriptional regulator n=1 Tax=Aquabacter sp. CN5-332 TaxID=3156608 RepID=UPI0032B37C10
MTRRAGAGMGTAHDIIGRGPSLAEVVAQRLREEISSGRLKAGERLPTEQQMAENYGVSRPIVREAVGRLKHDGLVLSRQGAGAFVAEPGAVSTFRIDIADFSNKDEIRNIVELLMAVEANATALAAVRRTAENLEHIQAQLDAMQVAIDRGDPGVDEDVAFHRAIVEATDNPFFRDLSDFLDRRVRNFIRTARSNSARLQGLTEAVQQEHQAIFDAIAKGHAGEARAAAEAHLKNAAARLALYLHP